MSQDNERERQDHLHGDQDEVGGIEEEPFHDQSGDSNVEPPGAGGHEHGDSPKKPFGHDAVDEEPGVDPQSDEDSGSTGGTSGSTDGA